MAAHSYYASRSKVLFYFLYITSVNITVALERCPDETGGGFCPSLNTCCRKKGQDRSGCIPSDLGALNATCCDDGLTGCGVGYVCGPDQTCIAKPDHTDPLVQRLPRYRLCSAPNLQRIYGLGQGAVRPAYYSSVGDLEASKKPFSQYRHAIISIHGASRNADDYYCSMHSATRSQTQYPPDELVIVAPRFAAESDGGFALHNGGIPMRWKGGSWRYGQESTSQVSSFKVLDDIVVRLSNSTTFPDLQTIRIIGHSAGGQFVQRWALLTDAWRDTPSLRVIVVNPSSYAYLTPLRKLPNQEWKLPQASKCPKFDYWEWGLETNDDSPLFVRRVLDEWPLPQLISRFATRDVVYLVGDRDVCNVSGMDKRGWCYSHGLETLCMDLLEGKNRLERHMNYFESLGKVNLTSHRRDLVPGVGHDHSLIFHSETTGKYLFDSAPSPGTRDGAKNAMSLNEKSIQ